MGMSPQLKMLALLGRRFVVFGIMFMLLAWCIKQQYDQSSSIK